VRSSLRGRVALGMLGLAAVGAAFVATGRLMRGRSALERGSPPNVILLIIDTLRADALGAYGSTAGASPSIDRIAAQGLRFTGAIAQASWTIPSISSLLTSRYPPELGWDAQRGGPTTSSPTLPEILASKGYATAAFAEVTWPLMERGFGRFENVVGDTSERLSQADRNGASLTFGAAIEWLRENRRSPFLMLIHTYEVHDYFTGKAYDRAFASRADPSYGGRFLSWSVRRREQDMAPGDRVIEDLLGASDEDIRFITSLYHGALAAVDVEVGKLDSALTELGLNENTIVVMTADHGEGFSRGRNPSP